MIEFRLYILTIHRHSTRAQARATRYMYKLQQQASSGSGARSGAHGLSHAVHLDQLGGGSNPARAVTAEALENHAAQLGRRRTCSRIALSNRDALSDQHGRAAALSDRGGMALGCGAGNVAALTQAALVLRAGDGCPVRTHWRRRSC
jgi:hypothetical protein